MFFFYSSCRGALIKSFYEFPAKQNIKQNIKQIPNKSAMFWIKKKEGKTECETCQINVYNIIIEKKKKLKKKTKLTWPSTGSSCCNVASTNTAVFPIPDFA